MFFEACSYVYWLIEERKSSADVRPVMKSLKTVTNLPKTKFIRGRRTPEAIMQKIAIAVVIHPTVSLYINMRWRQSVIHGQGSGSQVDIRDLLHSYSLKCCLGTCPCPRRELQWTLRHLDLPFDPGQRVLFLAPSWPSEDK
jgi:hypothetical protein